MRVFANAMGLLAVALALFFWFMPYEAFTEGLVAWANSPERLARLQEDFLTRTHFLGLRLFVSAFALLLILLRGKVKIIFSEVLIFFKASRKVLCFYLRREFLFFRDGLRGKEAWLFWATFFVLSAARAFVILHYPPSLDEAFSYAYLIARGPLVTLAYYPGPNNHILYNLLAWPFCALFSGEIWAQRLPNFFLALFFYPLFFSFLRRNLKSFVLALSLFVAAQLLPQVWYYSAHARGYFLCFVLAFFHLLATWKLEENEAPLRRWTWLWGLSFVLGCATIPIFVLVGAASVGFVGLLSLKNGKLFWRKAKKYAVISFYSGLGLLFFYIPVLFFSGTSLLFGNAWVSKSVTFWEALGEYALNFPMHRLQMEGAISLFLGSLIALCVGVFWNKKLALFGASLLLFPTLVVLLKQVLPPARVWSSLLWAELIGLGFGLWALRKYTSLLPFFCVVLFLGLAVFHVIKFKHTKGYAGFYAQLPVVEEWLKKKRPQKLHTNSDTWRTYAAYFSARGKWKVKLSRYDAKKPRPAGEAFLLPPSSGMEADFCTEEVCGGLFKGE